MIKLNNSAFIRPIKLPPSAWHGHIPFAGWLTQELRPTLFVELGTHYGASYLSFCQTIQSLGLSTKSFAVDTWQGDEHADFYGDSVYAGLSDYHGKLYKDFSKLLRCTFDEALEKFSDGSVDLLHIDGLHTYEAVRHDFETWRPKLSRRAVVLFHDTQERHEDFGVWRFWEEISKEFPNFEFGHSHGLGVLLVGDEIPSNILQLAALDNEEKNVISQLFAVLGHGVEMTYERDWWKNEVHGLGPKAAHLEAQLASVNAQLALASERYNAEAERFTAEAERFNAEAERVKSMQLEIQSLTSAVSSCSERAAALEARLRSDIQDRDDLIVNMSGELHQARLQLNSPSAKAGRYLSRLRARFAPDASLRGRLVWWGIRKIQDRRNRALGRVDVATHDRGFRLSRPQAGYNPPEAADCEDFARYIEESEPSPSDLTAQEKAASEFSYTPKISFIIPIYKLPRNVLEETLRSVELQTYKNWETCLAWADTEDSEGWNWLASYCATDSRHKPVLLESNGGISENSNAALRHAEGEFVALLDHDDTITPWALHDMVSALQGDQDVDFLYSDKDSMDAEGRCRMNALFKPAWSPEMLHSVNYLTHFNLMRTSIVREIGGWNKETDGAQDWDIFFRVTSVSRRVVRVPSIHYHWRILPTSTAMGLQTKPYAIMGQLRTQKNYFESRNLPAQVKRTEQGLFHITWPVNDKIAQVIVLQRGTEAELVNVLNLLLASSLSSLSRINVIHKGEAGAQLKTFERERSDLFRFIRNDEPELAFLVQLVDDSSAEVAVFVDSRSVGLSGGAVDELVGWVSHHPEIAWVSALAVDGNGQVLEAGRVVAHDGSSAPLFSGAHPHEYGWFGGAQWYRNASSSSIFAGAFKVKSFIEAARGLDARAACDEEGFRKVTARCVEGRLGRGLVDPFAVVYMPAHVIGQWDNDGARYHSDPYFNPAFKQVSPLRLKK